mgnify:CR=1 FL=1
MHSTVSPRGAVDSTAAPPAEALAYSVPVAGRLIGLSPRQAWRLVKAGKLRSYMDGGRRLVSRRALEEYVAAKEAAAKEAA